MLLEMWFSRLVPWYEVSFHMPPFTKCGVFNAVNKFINCSSTRFFCKKNWMVGGIKIWIILCIWACLANKFLGFWWIISFEEIKENERHIFWSTCNNIPKLLSDLVYPEIIWLGKIIENFMRRTNWNYQAM